MTHEYNAAGYRRITGGTTLREWEAALNCQDDEQRNEAVDILERILGRCNVLDCEQLAGHLRRRPLDRRDLAIWTAAILRGGTREGFWKKDE